MTCLFKSLIILLFASVALKAGFPPKDEILDSLPQTKYGRVAQKEIQYVAGAGSNTESVCRILIERDNGTVKTLICKELKGRKRELENLEALKPFVNQHEKLRESQPYEFPPRQVAFAKYKGALKTRTHEFALFNQASGQSVFDIMLDWTQKGYGWQGLSPRETMNKLAYAFSNVGRAIATFHLKNGTFKEESSTFYSVLHGDLHTANIFYNLWINQTTFIDYETMANSYMGKGNISADLSRLFEFSKKETAKLVEEKACEKFAKSRTSIFLDEKTREQQIAYVKQHLTLLDDFFDALKKGYTQAFKDAGYICDLERYKVTKVSSLNQCL